MLEKTVRELIQIGSRQEYLERIATSKTSVHGEWMVIGAISRFFSDLEGLGLTVTIRAASQLREFRNELAKTPADTVLGDANHERLQELMKEVWPTLAAESGGMIAYLVSERRFPVERLMGDVGGLFAKDVFKKLPSISQQDFTESAKCLAFERATAAAFHMLRGTESALKWYYCNKLHRNRSDLMWGAMIASMRKYPRRFPAPLVNHLDHIRHSFRNPTAHPEKIYDIDEAQDLLSICIDVANRIVQQQA
jgi:hypothetical protein